MPHQFDSLSFGQLLDDAQKLRDGAAALEDKLADLAARDAGTTEAYAASREQTNRADNILRRFVGQGAEDAISRGRPVVLVVDDSQDAREATALLLEQAGFKALTAANGLEALLVAHYAKPAVALLDLMMPVLDGLQTARLLSESPSTAQVKVIAYSGRADMFSRRLPGTFTAILAKPTTPQELLSLVQQQAGV
jgi:two-component system, sensor histidine kinase